MFIRFNPAEHKVISELEKASEPPKKDKLAEIGLKLFKPDSFWAKQLNSEGIRHKIAVKYLNDRVSGVIKKANIAFATLQVGVKDKSELKTLQKQGYIGSDRLLKIKDEASEKLVEAHASYQILKGAKDKNSWISQLLAKAGLQKMVSELKLTQLDEVKTYCPILVQNLAKLQARRKEAGPVFEQLARGKHEEIPDTATVVLGDKHAKQTFSEKQNEGEAVKKLNLRLDIAKRILEPLEGPDTRAPVIIEIADSLQKIQTLWPRATIADFISKPIQTKEAIVISNQLKHLASAAEAALSAVGDDNAAAFREFATLQGIPKVRGQTKAACAQVRALPPAFFAPQLKKNETLLDAIQKEEGAHYEQFVRAYLKEKEPNVFNGKKLLEKTEFYGLGLEEQIILFEKQILSTLPSLRDEFAVKLLTAPGKTFNKRYEQAVNLNKWTEKLAGKSVDPMHQLLASCLVEELEPFITEQIGERITEGQKEIISSAELSNVFEYAKDLQNKDIYSTPIIARGIRQAIESSGDFHKFAITQMPITHTVSSVKPTKTEKQIFSECMRAHAHKAAEEYLKARKPSQVYGESERWYTDHLLDSLKGTDRLHRKNPAARQYVEELVKKGLDLMASPYFYTPSAAWQALNNKKIQIDLGEVEGQDIKTLTKLVEDIQQERRTNPPKRDYGQVLTAIVEHTPEALMTFIEQLFIHALQDKDREQVKGLKKALSVVVKSMKDAGYGSLKEILTTLQNLKVLDADDAKKVTQGVKTLQPLLKLIKMSEVNAESLEDLVRNWTGSTPDGSSLLESKLIPKLYEQIVLARDVPPPENGLAGLIANQLPLIRKILTSSAAQKSIRFLGGAKGRSLVAGTVKKVYQFANTEAGKYLVKMFGGEDVLDMLDFVTKGLSSEDRVLIVDAIPTLLHMVDLIGLTKKENASHLKKITDVLDTLIKAAKPRKDMNYEQFSQAFMGTFQELLLDGLTAGGAAIAALQAIGTPRPTEQH